VAESQPGRVQREARWAQDRRGLGGAVLAIAEHRMAQMLSMDADLVRASGL
jgi:hypothetical protein